MGKTDVEFWRSEFEQANEQVKLMRRLATRLGFFQYYFENLKEHRTQVECFIYVNEKYFDLFGEYRYSDYDSFRKLYNKNTHLLSK
ncbi:hypothetical protein [Flagellimonas sp.]|uniref:hypothetical protein n=1 Tax=Flagellimonas sp. TaxID=2058762 RepID=UPI003F49E4E1